MQVLYILFLVVFVLFGAKVAILTGPSIGRLMGLIWVDPSIRRRTAVVRRIKELCVDGDVPNETAVLMAANEAGVSEDAIREVLDGMTPATMKAISKGGMLGELLQAGLKARRKIKGG